MKTVLITGAGGGIGKLTSLHFAKNNWKVIATVLFASEGDDLIIFRIFFVMKWMLLHQKVLL